MIPNLFFVILISKAPKEIHQNPRLKLPECVAFRSLLSQFSLGRWGSKSPNLKSYIAIFAIKPSMSSLQKSALPRTTNIPRNVLCEGVRLDGEQA